ncbi:MAG TPA: ABC transporter substrate-binding protein, partial [Gammaproteobacteria bacterium]|nr:ABC transporter substrate-binding protein [Gammaproteobacteria bacterium]
QMGGWFNKPIESLEDLQGLKMRIPGIAGEIWNKAGGTSVMLPGGEIFQALEKGTIDATEWLGPANDLAFGLPQIAKYYYMPGWHEPGSMLEFSINKKAFEALPSHYQFILKIACQSVADKMLNFYTAANAKALETIKSNPNVEIRQFPSVVLDKLYQMTQEVLSEMAASSDDVKKVYDSYTSFQKQAQAYNRVSEEAYYRVRTAIESIETDI